MVMMKRTDGEADLRGGGTSSARMTALLVAVAVVGGWLKQHGVQVEAHLGAVGDVEVAPHERLLPRWANETCQQSLRCRDPTAAERMAELIDRTRRERNSIGSRVDLRVSGLLWALVSLGLMGLSLLRRGP